MIRKILEWLPAWTLTGVCAVAIAWLTLAPQPLGDTDLPLFPGADKIVHAIMFGGLALCMMLDRQRKCGWKALSWRRGAVCALVSSVCGLLVEWAQDAMGMGRSKDVWDLVADTAGAFAFAIVYLLLQKNWSLTPKA